MYAYIDTQGAVLVLASKPKDLTVIQAIFPAVVSRIDNAPNGLKHAQLAPHPYHRLTSGDGSAFGDYELLDHLETLQDTVVASIEERATQLLATGFTFSSKVFSLSSETQSRLLGLYATRNQNTYPIVLNSLGDMESFSITDKTVLTNLYLTAMETLRGIRDDKAALLAQARVTTDQAGIDVVVANTAAAYVPSDMSAVLLAQAEKSLSQQSTVSAYDSTGGQSFTGTVTVSLDSTLVLDSTFYALTSSEITISFTGRVEISAQCTMRGSGNKASAAESWVERNALEIPGTRSTLHLDKSNYGGTGTASVFLEVAAGDIVRLRAQRTQGISSISTRINGSRLSIRRTS
jgi:hypothetical protein